MRGTQGTCRPSIPAKGELRVGVYYYDSAPVYPPGAMIYDPQTGRAGRRQPGLGPSTLGASEMKIVIPECAHSSRPRSDSPAARRGWPVRRRATMFNWLWRLTMTEVGVLLILGAICIYGRRMVSELRRVNHHLRALRNDEDRRRAQAERELLAPGLPRVEVLSSTAAAWSQGGTYAVQISDPAGHSPEPMYCSALAWRTAPCRVCCSTRAPSPERTRRRCRAALRRSIFGSE